MLTKTRLPFPYAYWVGSFANGYWWKVSDTQTVRLDSFQAGSFVPIGSFANGYEAVGRRSC